MEYDESKKLDVKVSENDFVENRVSRPREKKKHGFDIIDITMIPVIIGVFVSLGFLFANLFKATAAVDALNALVGMMGA